MGHSNLVLKQTQTTIIFYIVYDIWVLLYFNYNSIMETISYYPVNLSMDWLYLVKCFKSIDYNYIIYSNLYII